MIRTLLLRFALSFALLAPAAAFAIVEQDDLGEAEHITLTMTTTQWNAFQADMRAALGISSGTVSTIYLDDAGDAQVQVNVAGRTRWWEIGLERVVDWIREAGGGPVIEVKVVYSIAKRG